MATIEFEDTLKPIHLDHLKGQSPEFIRIHNHFSTQLLSQGQQCSVLISRAAEAPEHTLLQLYSAMLYLYDMTTTSFSTVRVSTHKILEKKGLTNYEKALANAVLATANNQFSRAINLFEAITQQFPQDLISFKFCEYLYFICGYDFCKTRFLNHSARLASLHASNPYLLASHAFAQSLNKAFTQSEQTALKAIDIEPVNPWAHHALAHVYLMQGKIDKGLSDLESFAPLWRKSAWTALCHNSWHLGLFMIANLKLQQAEDLCMRQLWDGMQEHQFVHIDFDVISLLWRLELAGHTVNPSLFALFRDHLTDHINHFVCPYQTAHYIYALVKAGEIELADNLVIQAEKESERMQPQEQQTWRLALVFLKGVNAFVNEDYHLAASYLESSIADINRYGGSDGQIDLFYQTYLYCLIKTQQTQKASQILLHRLKENGLERRPYPLEMYWNSLL
ncbi:MAG: hypothetical protein COB51_13420 [Moraxellaceae bacterium]|nr:MAG: hypothetical protein COB51_13420 [Moraxellaceae bacterium]